MLIALLQGQGHLAAAVTARRVNCGSSEAALSQLCQQPWTVRTRGVHPVRRDRRQLLCSHRPPLCGCLTHQKIPSERRGWISSERKRCIGPKRSSLSLQGRRGTLSAFEPARAQKTIAWIRTMSRQSSLDVTSNRPAREYIKGVVPAWMPWHLCQQPPVSFREMCR